MSLVGFVMIIVVSVILLSEPSLIMAAGVNHNNVSYIVINVFSANFQCLFAINNAEK